MKRTSYIIKLLFQVVFTLSLNEIYCQHTEECVNSIIFKSGSLVKTQVDNNGYSTLLNNQQFALSSTADGVHYLEAALIYTRDSTSDRQGNYWIDSCYYQILKNNNVIDTGTLRIKNQLNEAFFEQVGRVRIDSSQSTYTLKIIRMGSVVNQGSYLPSDIRVEFRVKSYRVEKLDTIKPSINLSLNSFGNQLDLKWDMKKGADFYEIEYAFIDAQDASIPTTEDEKFANALRIETIHNTYSFDLIYPYGILYYRVRAVGRHIRIQGLINAIKSGDWSSSQSYSISSRFSPDRPYQFTSSYAEEGKNKKVVNYFDNTLRSRQEVVYLNDEKVSLIGETNYDAEGRKSLSILPVPDPSGTNDLLYKNKFNKDINSNSDGYNFTHFDNLNAALALSPNSGSGKYYNAANTLGGIYNAYIPDAGGKPFLQTKFLRDNTDRISAQGGVGSFYQLGTGRETSYYYLTPTSVELQRLFGTEVGDPSHYKKNIIIDPNGQGTVTYIDLTGKSIATALMGSSPTNVLPLDTSGKNMITAMITDNIADPNSILSSNQLFCEVNNSTFSFYYDLKPLAVKLKDSCKICSYNVSFYARDNMGMMLPLSNFNSGTKNGTYNSTTGIYTVPLSSYGSWNCTQNTDTLKQAAFNIVVPAVGDFSVFKKLESVPINEKDLIKIAKSVVDSSKIAQYVQSQNDSLHCFYTCDFYCQYFVLNDPSTKNLSQAGKDSAIAACLKLTCSSANQEAFNDANGSDCESIRLQMAQQFEPYSTPMTFLQTLKNGNDTACVKARNISIIDSAGREFIWQGASNSLFDVDSNKLVSPTKITLNNNDPDKANKTFTLPNQLIGMLSDSSYYQESWGDSLINCHREYCWYLQCLATTDSTNFQERLSTDYKNYMNIDTGYLHANPAYTVYRKDAARIDTMIINRDPFFPVMSKYAKCPKIDTMIRYTMLDSVNSTYLNRFNNKADLLSLFGTKYAKNMLGYIALYVDSAYCKNKPGGCTSKEKEDQLWIQFINMYKELKTERSFSCSDCVLMNDTNAIVIRSPQHDVHSLDSLLQSEKSKAIKFKSDYICQGSVESWLNIIKEKYNGLSTSQLDSLSNYLKSHCEQICNPNATMHCLVDARSYIDTLSSYCGGANTIKLDYYKRGVLSRRNVTLYANNNSTLHPTWLGQSITPVKEKLFQFMPDSNVYTGNLPIRLTIYPETCGGPITDSIFVAVYQHAGACSQQGPNYGGQVAIQKLYNQFGALTIEWPHKFDPSFQSINYYTIQFFKESNTGTDSFSFQIETAMQFRTSDFHNTNTYLKLDALSNISNFIRVKKNSVDTATAYVKDIWDCEHSCKVIDTCLTKLLDSIKNYTNYINGALPKGTKNFTLTDNCNSSLSLTNSDSISTFSYIPKSGSSSFMNYFIDEYG